MKKTFLFSIILFILANASFYAQKWESDTPLGTPPASKSSASAASTSPSGNWAEHYNYTQTFTESNYAKTYTVRIPNRFKQVPGGKNAMIEPDAAAGYTETSFKAQCFQADGVLILKFSSDFKLNGWTIFRAGESAGVLTDKDDEGTFPKQFQVIRAKVQDKDGANIFIFVDAKNGTDTAILWGKFSDK